MNSGSEGSLLALEWERDLEMAVSMLHGGPVITEAVQKKMQFYTGIQNIPRLLLQTSLVFKYANSKAWRAQHGIVSVPNWDSQWRRTWLHRPH